jgi:TP901 family phage tail tape measure protein
MSKAQMATKKFGAKLSGMQSTLGTVAGAIGGAAAVRIYNTFETQMNKLAAVSLTTKEKLAKMRDLAKEMGEKTQFSATQAAAGMEQLKLAGLSVAKVIGALPGTMRLAAAGQLSMATAADIATGVLGAMKMKIKDLPRINDVLALAQSKAKFTITELAESMRPVATTARNLGIRLEELVSSLGMMATANERGSIAGTLFRNALVQVAGASKKQRRIYRKLGIDLSDYLKKTGEFKNFKGFVAHLGRIQKAGKLTVPILKNLFGMRGFRAMQIIVGAGVKPLTKMENALKKAGGTAERMAKIQMRGLPGIFKLLKSVSEALVIALFESGLDKWIQKVGLRIVSLIKALKNANPIILKIVSALGAFVVVAGPVLFALGMIVSGVGALMTPVVGVIALFTAFGATAWALKDKNKGLNNSLSRLWKTVKFLIQPFIDLGFAIGDLFKGLNISFFDILAGSLRIVADAINMVLSPFKALKTIYEGLITGKGFMGSIGAGWESLKGAFGGGPSVSAQNATAMKGSLNGKIDITARGQIDRMRAEVTSSLPGNLGFNMVPEGAF